MTSHAPRTVRRSLALGLALVAVLAAGGLAGSAAEGDPARGERHLRETAYHRPAFDQETFDAVWRVWPEPLRAQAEQASPEERRRMAYARYGLDARPDDPAGRPVQYVVDEAGQWSMSCLTCHAGSVGGRVVPGLPNAHLALQTLHEEIRATKQKLGKPLTPADLASVLVPMNASDGTTNAVMFSVSLLSLRDIHLNLLPVRRVPEFRHHDLDAPAWWNVKKRSHLYVDGFAPKAARPLMQFVLTPDNGPDRLRTWEQDFVDILAYLESLEPPRWPHDVDAELVSAGRAVFERTCAGCHGTYGDEPTYPNRRVPIEVVGTDPLRLQAVTSDQRATYAKSWLTDYDPSGVVIEPDGYVAPPLDGIWATAPYLHNGSVPTLWHLLHADERPPLWRRSRTGYDAERVGLQVEILEALPPEAGNDARVRRTVFDASAPGKSRAGHRFPEALSKGEKRAVLEYLKTL